MQGKKRDDRVFANFCIWLGTRNWKRLVMGASITYVFMLLGVLGADLIYNSKPPRLPAIIGYILVFASYAGTAAFWSSLRGSHASRRRQPPDQS